MRKISPLFLLLIFFQAPAQDTLRLRLLFAGDIMQHDSNIAAAWDPLVQQYDYSYCFQYIAPLIQEADIAIGNLELTLGGKPYKGYPQFSAPDALAEELKRIGFDVLVTANNHSVDRGRKGIERTLAVLDTLQMLHTGTFKDSADRAFNYPLLLEKNGFRISLLNYTYGTNGIPVPKPTIVNLIDTTLIKSDLQKAKQQHPDAIVVYFHWGNEYESLPNKEQKRLTEMCFREGVTVVMGAHPHVLQPMEWRKETGQFVAYSLGNFISGQRPRYRDGGAMVWLDFEKIIRDSLAVTSIRNAEYELAWVMKTAGEKSEFVMLPFRYFETDSAYFGNSSLREAFHVFKTDSRQLLAKHNVNVAERITEPVDSIRYSIRLGAFPDSLAAGIIDHPVFQALGLQRQPKDRARWLWFAGKFSDCKAAEKMLAEIKDKTDLKSAKVVRLISSAY
jgi:poly-gamma-glutamate capsule biosynthesis protein CapA/YwtB (metallophosphatase superfamily)